VGQRGPHGQDRELVGLQVLRVARMSVAQQVAVSMGDELIQELPAEAIS
jgi:hypothetical protein